MSVARPALSVGSTVYPRHNTALAQTAQVEHHSESASDNTWSYTAYLILPQIDYVHVAFKLTIC